jgi:glucosyl-3-phosphoglycerate phosphatase
MATDGESPLARARAAAAKDARECLSPANSPAPGSDEETNTIRVFLCRHGETDHNAARRVQGSHDIPLNERGKRQAALLGARLARTLRHLEEEEEKGEGSNSPAPNAGARAPPKFGVVAVSPLSRARHTAAFVVGAVEQDGQEQEQGKDSRKPPTEEEVDITLELDEAMRTLEGMSKAHVLPGLAEMDFGEMEGKHVEEVFDDLKVLHDRWEAGEFDAQIPGGESAAQMAERAQIALAGVLEGCGPEVRTALVVCHGRLLRGLLCSILDDYDLTQMRRIEQVSLGGGFFLFAFHVSQSFRFD